MEPAAPPLSPLWRPTDLLWPLGLPGERVPRRPSLVPLQRAWLDHSTGERPPFSPARRVEVSVAVLDADAASAASAAAPSAPSAAAPMHTAELQRIDEVPGTDNVSDNLLLPSAALGGFTGTGSLFAVRCTRRAAYAAGAAARPPRLELRVLSQPRTIAHAVESTRHLGCPAAAARAAAAAARAAKAELISRQAAAEAVAAMEAARAGGGGAATAAWAAPAAAAAAGGGATADEAFERAAAAGASSLSAPGHGGGGGGGGGDGGSGGYGSYYDDEDVEMKQEEREEGEEEQGQEQGKQQQDEHASPEPMQRDEVAAATPSPILAAAADARGSGRDKATALPSAEADAVPAAGLAFGGQEDGVPADGGRRQRQQQQRQQEEEQDEEEQDEDEEQTPPPPPPPLLVQAEQRPAPVPPAPPAPNAPPRRRRQSLNSLAAEIAADLIAARVPRQNLGGTGRTTGWRVDGVVAGSAAARRLRITVFGHRAAFCASGRGCCADPACGHGYGGPGELPLGPALCFARLLTHAAAAELEEGTTKSRDIARRARLTDYGDVNLAALMQAVNRMGAPTAADTGGGGEGGRAAARASDDSGGEEEGEGVEGEEEGGRRGARRAAKRAVAAAEAASVELAKLYRSVWPLDQEQRWWFNH